MTQDLKEKIAELERLEKEATQSAWYYDSYAKIFSTVLDSQEHEWDYFISKIPTLSGDATGSKQGRTNAEFIALSRNLLPAILAELRRLREITEKCSKAFDEIESEMETSTGEAWIQRLKKECGLK